MRFNLWMQQELGGISDDHLVLVEVEFGDDTINDGPGGPNLPEVILTEAIYWSDDELIYLPYPLREEEFEKIIEHALSLL